MSYLDDPDDDFFGDPDDAPEDDEVDWDDPMSMIDED